jgi:DNA-binding beta-propeller fold protein YncE
MRKILRTSCLAIVVLFGFVALTCDEDCPVCPKEPEPVPEGNYRLYAYDAGWNRLFSFDIPADTIIDSVTLDHEYSPADLDVSPDGNKIIVPKWNANVTEIYRASDLNYLGTVPRIGNYHFDPQGDYLACLTGDRVVFLDPLTFSPLDSLLLSHKRAFLDTVNSWLFAADVDSMWIYRIDCLSHSLLDTIRIRLPGGGIVSIYEFAYNWLTDEIYFHAQGIAASYFIQYSVSIDSLISSTSIRGQFGGVAVSPDGRSVYMVDGGNGAIGVRPIGYLWIFDALTHEVVVLLPPYIYPDSLLFAPAFGKIMPTPDGRRLYLGMSRNAMSVLPIIDVDLVAKKMVKGFPCLGMFYEFCIGKVPDK